MTDSPAPLVGDITQLAISVEDLERAIAFYRDVLGLPFLFQVPGMPMAFFQCGSVRLYLDAGTSEHRSNPIIYFAVDDVQAAYEQLRERGVEFESEPHVINRTDTTELWLAHFRDTEGTLLSITHDKPL